MRTDARYGESKVPLLKELFGPQLDRLQTSMRLTAERHALLAENLANVNTPGYHRKDASFELVLETKLKGPQRVQELRRRLYGTGLGSAESGNGEPPELEREVLAMSETELRYQALTDFASSHISGLRNVIREGR
ncbi:MAG: hypothetical protein HZC36_16425 [Armatimonadetes bacterium]|nr:hypothetical protein [Armatimonadota bacterium]